MQLAEFLSHHGYQSLEDFEQQHECTIRGSSYHTDIEAIDWFVRSYYRGSRVTSEEDPVELKKRIKAAQTATRKFLFLKEKAIEIIKKYLEDSFEISPGVILDEDITFSWYNNFGFLGYTFSFYGLATDSSFKINSIYCLSWVNAYKMCEKVNKFKAERNDSKH